MDPVDAQQEKREEQVDFNRPPPLVLSKEDLGLDGRKRRRKRASKRASSRTSRRLQDIEWRASKVLRRVTRSAEHGVSEYIDWRDKSEKRRSDGPLVDLYENVARGASVAISEASPAVVDVAKALNTNASKRQVRRFLKGFPRLPIIPLLPII